MNPYIGKIHFTERICFRIIQLNGYKRLGVHLQSDVIIIC